MVDAKEWLNEEYPIVGDRKKIIILFIEKKDLTGCLDLSDFVTLKYLFCAHNKLNALSFPDVITNLEGIDCSYNELSNLDWLKRLKTRNLTHLNISNNNKLFSDLTVFSFFVNLEHLNVSDSNFKGSLEPLGSCGWLSYLDIRNSLVEFGLEYLSISCKRFHCNSKKMTRELSKGDCLEVDADSSDRWYNIAKWREFRTNNLNSWSIPVEELSAIRSNFVNFVSRWSKKNNDLKPPNLRHKILFSIMEWIIKVTNFAGGFLSLNDCCSKFGGLLTIIAGLAHSITSHFSKSYDKKQQKRKIFFQDIDKNFLNNYNNLVIIINRYENKRLDFGVIDDLLRKLNREIKVLLIKYDNDKDGRINLRDLIKKKDRELFQSIDKIITFIKTLEKTLLDYRLGKIW